MPEVSLDPDQDLMTGDPELFGDTTVSDEEGEPVYNVIYSQESEGHYNPFVDPSRMEVQQVTESELREMWEKSTHTQDQFGTFENYLAYTAEASDYLADTNWWDAEGIDTRTQTDVIRGEEDLGITSTQPADQLVQTDTNARQSGYQQWLMSEENQALLNKYGVEPTITNDKGDVFTWTGSGYIRTVEADEADFNDYLKAGLQSVVISALTAGAGTALTSAIQTATGLSTAAATAASSAIINSATQLALTGEIDPRQALASAIGGYIQGGGFGELGNSLGESELVSSVQGAWDDAMTAIDDVGGSFLQGGSEWLSKTIEAGGTDAIAQLISSGEIDPEQVITAGLSAGGQELIGDFIEQYGSQLFEQNEQQAIVDSEGNVLHVFDSDEAATAWADVNYVGPTGTAEGYQLGTVGSSIPEWMIPILEGGGAAAEALGGALDAVGIIDLGNDPNSAPPPSSGDLNTEAGYQPYFYKAPDGTTYYLDFETGEWTDVTTNPNLDQFEDQFNELDSGYYSDNLRPIGDQGGGGPNVGDIVQDVVDSIENNSPPTVTETETEPVVTEPPPVVTEPPPVVDGTDETDDGADNGANNGDDDVTDGDNGNNGANNGDDGANSGDGNAEDGDNGDNGDGKGDDGKGDGDGSGDGSGDGFGDGLGLGIGGSGMMSPRPFQTFMTGISYQAPAIQQIVQNPQVDYTASLNDIINRNSGMFG